MVSISTFYFLTYFIIFMSIGFIASLLILPLLGISFLFATGVVVFGFVSNLTFKMGQYIYFKTDRNLKKILDRMALQSGSKNQDQQIELHDDENGRYTQTTLSVRDENVIHH
ncbi:hypothetical protein KAFR_0B05010 [Kazachstania africana CBS 2517]|uniref:Outer spore wall protein 5 n=1 Tax=Kazachstania africana (strain ATCC 22294 / BCRC 22015 / CBS 2517 / CECT 1963 / NBRC 1671 / NRRL Y-8276) TaxID=1071382 RepID=H2AQZ7_KAZAF|nr:hypothetical protein KAFR_0B05010 [Kazachstania africana CBS 2517]CCF56797.1 hypothetical protein KAFR_0B05010 [Kazachstania africana CBS 2517]